MNPEIKAIESATENTHLQSLLRTNVKEVKYNEDAKHIIVYVDNQGAKAKLDDELDEPLRKALEAVYGSDDDITYEAKLYASNPEHEKEKLIPHEIRAKRINPH